MGTLCLHLPSIPAISREHGSTPVVLMGVVVPYHRPLVVTPKTQKQSKTKLKTKTKENIRARLNQTTSVFAYFAHFFQEGDFCSATKYFLLLISIRHFPNTALIHSNWAIDRSFLMLHLLIW